MKYINVVDDWTEVVNRVMEEINSSRELEEIVMAIVHTERIPLDSLIELYHEGLSLGIENGKYLDFNSWLREFFDIERVEYHEPKKD